MKYSSYELMQEFAAQYAEEHPEFTPKQISEAINGYWQYVKLTFLDDELHQTRIQYLGSFLPHKSAPKMREEMLEHTREKYPYLLEYNHYKLDLALNHPKEVKHQLSYKEYVKQQEKDQSDSETNNP